MSINPNCLEYLIGVAEKIINSFADPQTAAKYYSLKEQMILKYQRFSQNPNQALRESSKYNSKLIVKPKFSEVEEQTNSRKVRIQKKQNELQRDQRSSSILQKGRTENLLTETFQEKKSHESNSLEPFLKQLTSLLQNASVCPALLKTIRFTPIPDYKIRIAQRQIEISLSNIYTVLTQPQIKPIPQELNENNKSISLQETISDNQWLMEKLESLINQNSTLRRMVGQSSGSC